MRGFGTWLESELYQTAPRVCSCGASEKAVDKHIYTLNGKVIQCSECAPSQKHFIFTGPYRRIFSDRAARYILRFGGSTFSIKSDAGKYKVYLRNVLGFTIAEVFPKPDPAV